jgi:hypothetical protein
MERASYMQGVFGESLRSVEDVQPDELRLHRRFVAVLKQLGGRAKRSDVVSRAPMTSGEADAVVGVLMSEGLLRVEQVVTGGRPATVYRLVEP